MTRRERQAADNGVWLCQNDAKLIDDDTIRFDATLLRAWQVAAENAASREQGRGNPGPRLAGERMVPFRRDLPREREQLRTALFEYLSDVGAIATWGAHADLAYMTLFEIALNAVTHGGAKFVYIESDEHVVSVQDDGAPFGLSELRRGGRGAHLALKHLEETASGSLTARHQRMSAGNRWSLVSNGVLDGVDAPCSLAVDGSGRQAAIEAMENMSALEPCEEIHIHAPALWSLSDWAELLERLTRKLPGRTLVVHGIPHDSYIRGALQETQRHIGVPRDSEWKLRFPD
jgi:hypothetical protein